MFSMQKFSFEVKKGDLFCSPSTDSLAHCISEDCAMSKGIAVQFKKKFEGVEQLKSQGTQQTIECVSPP